MAEGSFSATIPSPAKSAALAPQVDLRPLTTSELIDRSFSLYRSHFAGLLLLALLSQTAPLVSQVVITATKMMPDATDVVDNPQIVLTRFGIVTGINLAAQVIGFCFDVVMTCYIADVYLGKIPSLKASLRQLTVRIGATLWTCVLNRLLIGLTLLFPLMVIAAAYFYALLRPPIDISSMILLGVVAFALFIASLVPVLVVFMRLWVTVPPLALEGLAGWKAAKRSSMLVRYDPGLGFLYWGEMRLSFLLLPLFVIELLVFSLTSLPLTLVQFSELVRHGSTGQMAAPPDSTVIISTILTFLAGSLILPLYTIVTTLFYYDIRIRREGFDLEFMAGNLREKR